MEDQKVYNLLSVAISHVKNVGGLSNIKQKFYTKQLSILSEDEENRIVDFEIESHGTEFYFKSFQFNCCCFFSDMLNLVNLIDHKIELLIGGNPTLMTTWAQTFMTETQLNKKNSSKSRGNELYMVLRELRLPNIISNQIVSYALILENNHHFLHYVKVPAQFHEIANEYMLDYKVNIHFGIREMTKPMFQSVKLRVQIPFGIRRCFVSIQKTDAFHTPLDEIDILHSQFQQTPIQVTKKNPKQFILNIPDIFMRPGYGFLLMVPFDKKWNIDRFSLLLFNYERGPLYCKKFVIHFKCIWFVLCLDESTTIQEMLSPKEKPKNNLINMSKCENVSIIMTNSNEEDIVFPKELEEQSCLIWQNFNIYRHSNGCGGDIFF